VASLKQHKTTSTFKRKYRREVYTVLRDLRRNEVFNPVATDKLVKVTLRQRSGHYMKKGVRQCYAQIPQEHRGA